MHISNHRGGAEQIVTKYSKHIERVARRFIKTSSNRKWFKDDLIQQGYIGLLEAHNKYDGRRITNGGFWGYAFKFVEGRMKDFTIEYTNQIRPSKKLNSIMLNINREDLINRSPDYIAHILGCTINMARQAVNLNNGRHIVSLYQPVKSTNDSDDRQFIDFIQSIQNPDDIFQVETINLLSQIEQNIVTMLIEQYSQNDIMTHYKLTEEEYQNFLDKIMISCGYEYYNKNNRNEEFHLESSVLEKDPQLIVDDIKVRLEWIDINNVVPNSKNPRKDQTNKTKEMQDILISKGWEESIICYKHGTYYIILSGHRRWYAAKQIGQKKVPVCIVEAPSNDAEELHRIGSVQGGQVDWTPYENMKYTYDLWEASGQPPYLNIGKILGIAETQVAARVRVYQYYPRNEIEDKLTNRMYSTNMLDAIRAWIKRLVKNQTEIVESMGEHLIRQYMLKKYENRCFNSQISNEKAFVKSASNQDILEFLTDMNRALPNGQMEMVRANSKRYKDGSQILRVNTVLQNITKIEYRTKKDAKKLFAGLEKLLAQINVKTSDLESYIQENFDREQKEN
ncbi:MAG TPA: ParB N-terminal domain-containing protein [Bacilli bacterium]